MDTMTRKEEREQAARNAHLDRCILYDKSVDTFIKGAEWADRTMVDKACELLVNCIEDFMLRRMEIWDKECKKQTLENILKKMEE